MQICFSISSVHFTIQDGVYKCFRETPHALHQVSQQFPKTTFEAVPSFVSIAILSPFACLF